MWAGRLVSGQFGFLDWASPQRPASLSRSWTGRASRGINSARRHRLGTNSAREILRSKKRTQQLLHGLPPALRRSPRRRTSITAFAGQHVDECVRFERTSCNYGSPAGQVKDRAPRICGMRPCPCRWIARRVAALFARVTKRLVLAVVLMRRLRSRLASTSRIIAS